jgi:hypothetical protein
MIAGSIDTRIGSVGGSSFEGPRQMSKQVCWSRFRPLAVD